MDQNRIFERLAAFEGWLHENGRAAGTQEKYLRDVRAFAEWAGGRPLTRELALAWREHLLTRCKAVTVNSMLAAVNSFLRFAGHFSLRRSAEGQRILCQVNGQPHEIVMPCPSAADAEVVIAREGGRLVMRLSGGKSSRPPLP